MRKKVQVALLHQDESKQILLLMLKLIPKRGALWQNVTGHVDEGENIREAAIRELQEETGIMISDQQLLAANYQFSFLDRYEKDCEEHGFYAWLPSKYSKQDIQIDPSEHTAFKWSQLNSLNSTSLGYSSNWELVNKVKALISLLIFAIVFSASNCSLATDKPYKLRLHKQEKNNIIAAVNSGSKLYVLAENEPVYDLIRNKTHYSIRPTVISVFNEPTLSGERYIKSYSNKVRYIVSSQSLRELSNDIAMTPQELEFKRADRTKPKTYIGAPHETKAP